MRYQLPPDNPFALKGMKEYPKMSEETIAFTADLTYKGKVVASCKNDGHGGSNMVYWCYNKPEGKAAEAALATYVKTLPPDGTFSDGNPFDINEDYFITVMVDTICQAKFDAKQTKKWLKLCAEYTVFRYEGDEKGRWRMMQTQSKTPLPTPQFQQYVAAKGKVEAVLNELISSDPLAFERF